MNILIVKLSAIGDVIHTLPSLAALRRLYPEAHITWVVEEAAENLVNNHPYLDEVVISRRKNWSKDLRKGRIIKPLKEFKSFLKELRKRPYDLVIDFHGLLKSSIIVLLSGGKRKLGYDSLQELSGLFYNEKIREDMNKHAVDRYLDFPRYLGIHIKDVDFTLPPEADVAGRFLLEQHRLENKKFIAVNPVAYWETKLWDDVKFARLADLIADKLHIKVVFTGSEEEAIKKITGLMKSEPVDLAGKTSLLELAHLYRQALAVVTTDSGPMHLAAAVGTPVIALFGPTDPARTGPYGDGHTIITAGLPCSPCFLKKCVTRKCMLDISPEQVLAVIENRIQGGNNAFESQV